MTQLPSLPFAFESVISRLNDTHDRSSLAGVVAPFREYEAKLRQLYAQQPTHPATTANHLVPIFTDNTTALATKARDLANETELDKNKYLLALSDKQRRPNGSAATVDSLKEFQTNFNLFSESSLVDLDWSNVVAAGSAVLTPLLPVSKEHGESKRTLRSYYHEQLAPASDVDLFIYGLDEAHALEKIKQIEARVRDSILTETTTIRTKNAITIVSEYPTRHIQIVLRLYKSVSEILTGFDVDCSAVAYDGNQVYASPRALQALATQCNGVDLTRRSPSYENRLAKYAKRGFEVFWSHLSRENIDPTIYERSFGRVQGLARLLVLEKLPHPQDRDEYSTARRKERGRPELPWNAKFRHKLSGDIKATDPNDIAEWVVEDDVSSYHTFTLPYGPRYTAKKIEKLVYSKDLLLNAEWNKPKDRKVNLHRHPAFFGTAEEVMGDCCSFCPKPETDEDLEILEEEGKYYVTGTANFLKDDPGRQEIGSFNPITDTDWTEMAYLGNTTRLCQAIVDNDLEEVQDWFTGEDVDVNRRDHTGRTPLHLAAMTSSPEIVHCLIEHGARIVSRLYHGMTALHIAAFRGENEIVKLLLDKSEQNEAAEDKKTENKKKTRRAAFEKSNPHATEDTQMTDLGSEPEDLMDEDLESGSAVDDDAMTEGSFVKVKADTEDAAGDDGDEPDFYNVDVVAWDNPVSPLHLAIIAGHEDVIVTLIDAYGADVLLPVKILTNDLPRKPLGAILSLLLPTELPDQKAIKVINLVLSKGANPSQADMDAVTAAHSMVKTKKLEFVKVLERGEQGSLVKSLNQVSVEGYQWNPECHTALVTAMRNKDIPMVRELLKMGVSPNILFDAWVKQYQMKFSHNFGVSTDPEALKRSFRNSVHQAISIAASQEQTLDLIEELIKAGADINTINSRGFNILDNGYASGSREVDYTVLDAVRCHRKRLEEFLGKEPAPIDSQVGRHKPEDLQAREYYLKDLPQESYRYWKALRDFENAQSIQEDIKEDYARYLQTRPRGPPDGAIEKRVAIKELLEKVISLEQRLIQKGAKDFYTLHPTAKQPDVFNQNHWQNRNVINQFSSAPYKNDFEFPMIGDSPAKQAAYLQLFEAVYAGDTEVVKNICANGGDHYDEPLQIAIRDRDGFSPFSLAVLRGHKELSEIVLEIAALQYESKDQNQRTHYALQAEINGDDDEDGSEAGSDESGSMPDITEQQIQQNFTIDDLHVQATKAKSHVHPSDLISDMCEIWRTMDGDAVAAKKKLHLPLRARLTSYWCNSPTYWYGFWRAISEEKHKLKHSLYHHAIFENDIGLLRFLIDMNFKYVKEGDTELLQRVNQPSSEDLRLAMNLGHIQIITEMIKTLGIWLPLNKLAKKSGVETKEVEKPKYYQGLTVHGKKRKDWANAHKNQNRHRYGKYNRAPTDQGSPLLLAMKEGTLDVIDYFLSGAPLRHYQDFARKFKDDKRLYRISQTEGGFETVVREWMEHHAELALHAAVLSYDGGSLTRLRQIMSRVPSSTLEVKSASGHTPLHLALSQTKIPLAELFIAAGANQRTVDSEGLNLLHTLYRHNHKVNGGLLSKLVEMLDPKTVRDLVKQKSYAINIGQGGQTPLASILSNYQNLSENDVHYLDQLLKISGGKDLVVINSAGEYPLHEAVKANNLPLVRYIVNQRPDLLYRENAIGMTPIEIAETAYFQTRLNINTNRHHFNNYYSIDNQTDSITERSVESFSTKKKPVPIKLLNAFEGLETPETSHLDANIPTTNPMYRLLRMLAVRHEQYPRTLVSILDVNEIAKRLAAHQKQKNERQRESEARGTLGRSRRSRYYMYTTDDNVDDEDGETGTGKVQRKDEITEFQPRTSHWASMAFRKIVENKGFEVALKQYRKFMEGAGEGVEMRCCDFPDHVDGVRLGMSIDGPILAEGIETRGCRYK